MAGLNKPYLRMLDFLQSNPHALQPRSIERMDFKARTKLAKAMLKILVSSDPPYFNRRGALPFFEML